MFVAIWLTLCPTLKLTDTVAAYYDITIIDSSTTKYRYWTSSDKEAFDIWYVNKGCHLCA